MRSRSAVLKLLLPVLLGGVALAAGPARSAETSLVPAWGAAEEARCLAEPSKDCVLTWAWSEVRGEELEAVGSRAAIAAVWAKPKLLAEVKAIVESRPIGTGRAFSLVALREGELGLADRAFRTAGKIPWITERSSALAKVVEALAKRGDYEKALNVAGRIPVSDYAVKAIGHIIQLQGRQGEISHGLEKAKKISGAGGDHLESRSNALAWIARSFARTGMPDAAVAAARKIRAPGHLARSLAGLGAMTDRPALFKEAVAVAEKAPEDLRDAALAGVAPRIAEAGRFNEALALHGKIERQSWRNAALAGIAPALAADGRLQEALDLVREISVPYLRGSAAYGIAAAVEDEGQIEELLASFRRFDAKTDYEVHKGIAGLLEARGSHASAIAVARKIFDPGMRAEALASLALLSSDKSLIDEAARTAQGFPPAQRSLAIAQACLDRPKDAVQTAARQKSPSLKLQILIDIAKCLPPQGGFTEDDLWRRKLRPNLPLFSVSPWSPQGTALALD